MVIIFPEIDPVVFTIGPFDVRWYALAYLTGFLLGWRYCMRLASRGKVEERPNTDDIDDFLPWAIAGVILGGRLGYVLFYHSSFYLVNPIEILKIWQGGMAFHGGVIGVIVSMVLFSVLRKIPLLRLADIVAACAPIGLFFGRIANFINGELWGRMTDGSWGIVFPHVGPEPRHPSQLYEAVLEGLLLFIILFVLIRLKAVQARPGIVAGTFLIGYAFFRSVIEFFREPDGHIGLIGGVISMGQVLSVPMLLGGLLLIIFACMRNKRHG